MWHLTTGLQRYWNTEQNKYGSDITNLFDLLVKPYMIQILLFIDYALNSLYHFSECTIEIPSLSTYF